MYNEYADPIWQYGYPETLSGEQVMEAFFSKFFVGLSLFALFFVILQIVCTWKLFKKAGEAGWKSIIPFYNKWVMIRIALGRNSIGWFIVSLIPLFNLLFAYVHFYFAKRFCGKDSLAILYLVWPAIVGILFAFSDRYRYIANRSREDSGRGGLDGDWPLWAEEEQPAHPTQAPSSRYDSSRKYPSESNFDSSSEE